MLRAGSHRRYLAKSQGVVDTLGFFEQQLDGGTTPANDILWNYVCAANDGVITNFTYASGTPP